MTTMTYSDVAMLVYNTAKACYLEPLDADSVFEFTNFDQFVDIMRYEGFTLLGTGFFAAVFKHEDFAGQVFKFGFKKEDSGAAYAAWCRSEWSAGRGCVAIPKIEHIERNSLFYMVVMPEYVPFKVTFPELFDVSGGMYYSNYDIKAMYLMLKVLRGVLNSSDYVEYVDILQDYSDNYNVNVKFAAALKDSALFLTLCNIHKHFEGVSSFDLHANNFMFTPEGVIVITDPVSFSKED